MSKARARWVERGPLMHDPYNRKWIYFQAHIEKYTVHRATIDDIMSAFKVTREVAASLYRSGDSPLSGKVLSRTRTREEPPEGDAPYGIRPGPGACCPDYPSCKHNPEGKGEVLS